ncbi:unnamed protein product [Rotaria socialis]|uniref:VCBS repeat-containing protein n=2 Tax=Rotaria socialis TaxID=392032 RepID=A0A817T0X2_9BILA|nr:unnamed protein product [Rotaria socialis]
MVALIVDYDNSDFTDIMIHSIKDRFNPTGLTLGDFNSGSRIDILTASFQTDNVVRLLLDKDELFLNSISYSTEPSSQPWYHDELLDITLVNQENNSFGIFFGAVNGKFANQIIYLAGNGSFSRLLTMGDLSNDTSMDLAVANTVNS